jgi:hypothetical protein
LRCIFLIDEISIKDSWVSSHNIFQYALSRVMRCLAVKQQ